MRKSVWKKKVISKANQALFLAKYILESESNNSSDISQTPDLEK